MTLERFKAQLKAALIGLDAEERDQFILYFQEIIADRIEEGMSEKEAIASLGDVQDLVANLRAEDEELFQNDRADFGSRFEEKISSIFKSVESRIPQSTKVSFNGSHIRRIIMELNQLDLVVRSNDYDQIVLEYPEGLCRTEESADCLTISQIEKLSWKTMLATMKPVRLEIPKGLLNTLVISQKMGDLAVAGLELQQSIELSLTTGDISLSGLKVGEDVALKMKSGDLVVHDLQAQNLRLDTLSGDVEVTKAQLENLKILATSGDICLRGVQVAKELHLQPTSGDLKIESCQAESILLEATSGDITLLASEVQESLTMMTTSGDISAQVLGQQSDYNIETQVTFGETNISNQVQPDGIGLLAKTMSGDIELEFLG